MSDSQEVDCFRIEVRYSLILDGRDTVLISLTLVDRCCKMKYAVYLSITEGAVPLSATEREVTNR